MILSLEVQTVQSSEKSEISPCLPTKKVASHNLMDTSRRHGTLVSETKDLIIHGMAGFIGFVFTLISFAPWSQMGHTEEPTGT